MIFANALQRGRDVSAELRTLGQERICQIYATDEDGSGFNPPRLDRRQVKASLDAMAWSGRLVVERSRDAKDARNVKRNFSANVACLKTVFKSSVNQPRAKNGPLLNTALQWRRFRRPWLEIRLSVLSSLRRAPIVSL